MKTFTKCCPICGHMWESEVDLRDVDCCIAECPSCEGQIYVMDGGLIDYHLLVQEDLKRLQEEGKKAG